MSRRTTFKFISKLGINLSANEYHDITLYGALRRSFSGYWKSIILKYCMYSILLSPFNYRLIRPYLWRKIGCKIGKNVFIGYSVWIDYNNASLIEIGNNVHITNMCLLLCHQRDLSQYKVGDDASILPYNKSKIIIEDGVMIGMNSTIMPGVRIGKGAIIGANSIVVKDVPAWTISAGNPAIIIRNLKDK